MVIVDPSITFKTESLFIRPLAMEDLADVYLMQSNPDVMKYTSVGSFNDIEETRAWIQSCHDRKNCWNFSIELLPTTTTGEEPERATPKVIGVIGAVRAPEIGYMLNPDYWGKGYATEALQAFLPLFFDHYSGGDNAMFEYAVAHTDPDVVSSQRVLQKAGFRFHERREKDFENHVLGWRDTLVFRTYRRGYRASESKDNP